MWLTRVIFLYAEFRKKRFQEGCCSDQHVPVIEQDRENVIVKVGSVEHPSLPAHYIGWILLETEQGSKGSSLVPRSLAERKIVKYDLPNRT